MNIHEQASESPMSLRFVLLFYAALSLAAWAWVYFVQGTTSIPLIIFDDRLLPGIFLAVALVGMTLALTPWILRHSEPMRTLAQEIRDMLGPLPRWKIFIIAVASGFGEELFFRGAMQASLGLIATSLIFGLLHGFPGTRFAHWGLFAVVAGFGFGLLQEYSGAIFPAFLAHMGINYWNLCRILNSNWSSESSNPYSGAT